MVHREAQTGQQLSAKPLSVDRRNAVICNMLSGDFCGNSATRYGRVNEPVVIMQYATEHKKHAPDFSMLSSGVVINTTWSWLAASPDAIACDPQAGMKCLR